MFAPTTSRGRRRTTRRSTFSSKRRAPEDNDVAGDRPWVARSDARGRTPIVQRPGRRPMRGRRGRRRGRGCRFGLNHRGGTSPRRSLAEGFGRRSSTVASDLLLVAARDAGFPETTEPHDGVVVFVAGGERGTGRGGALGGGGVAIAVPDVRHEERLAIPPRAGLGAAKSVAVEVAVGARVEEGNTIAAGAEEGVLAGALVRVRAGGGVGDDGHPHDQGNHEESADELTTRLAFPSRGAEHVVPAEGRQAPIRRTTHHVGVHTQLDVVPASAETSATEGAVAADRMFFPCRPVRQQLKRRWMCPTDRVFSPDPSAKH